ncbi:MAG: PIG-L family deacetylase [Verrucomicrobia bacterium]|nr:PIG-L family deacetylase [Verrucomicrobiota bacterium]
MAERSAIAVAAHPDDIEFVMAGTLCLLREAGYRIHYLNIATGSCGSLQHRPAALRRIRRREARKAAAVLGARFHASRADDLEIFYTLPLLRWLTGVMREVRPTIVLTHSPQDYMEDHANTSRLAVTAAFARGMPNFATGSRAPVWSGDATVYHAMPHGLCDGLRRRIVPGLFVDTTSVQEKKLAALACHESQHGWLKATQGMNSYLRDMETMAREVGRMSRRFPAAEGWRRHSHMGFCPRDADPLREALGKKVLVNRAYEHGLLQG